MDNEYKTINVNKNDKDEIILNWKFKIQSLKSIKKTKNGDKSYVTFIASLPYTLCKFLGTDYVFFYKKDDNVFLTSEKPFNKVYKKIKINNRKRNIKNCENSRATKLITLPKIMFKDLNNKSLVIYELNTFKIDECNKKRGQISCRVL